MNRQVRSIEALRAELARQDEERARLSRVAASHADVCFAIGEAFDAELGELCARVESEARGLHPRLEGTRGVRA